VRHVTVIGAGVVGACTALALRRDGYAVTLIERGEPGMGTSFGNAGMLSVTSCVPIAQPGILWKVPRLLADPLGPLTIDWRYLPKLAPWLMRFVAASAPARVEHISKALMSLLVQIIPAYRELLGPDAFQDLARPGGILYAYQSDRAFESSQRAHALRRKRGVTMAMLDQSQLRQTEPSLAPSFKHGVLMPDSYRAVNPLRLTQTVVQKFTAEGGELVTQAVDRIERGERDRLFAVGNGQRRELDTVVITAGAWSKRLARDCGINVPLETERGYHVMLPNPGVAPRLSISSGDHEFGVTPMEHGLRLAGTVELAGLDKPPNWARADVLLRAAKEMFPGLNDQGATTWMGHRPSMPDSLPVIARAPSHERVFFGFGHGHLGLTFGAITGFLIADLIAGRPSRVDLEPFRADRF
jgi:D-amino-acid dehydrogenase